MFALPIVLTLALQRTTREQLGVDDLGGLAEDDRIEAKFAEFQRIYTKKPSSERSLLWSILAAFKKEYLISVIICTVGAAFQYMSPFLIQALIEFISTDDPDTAYGLKVLSVMVATQLISYILFQHLLYKQVMIGVRSTNCLIHLVYKKQLRISAATNKRFASGQIVNFVQVDAEQLMWLCFEMADILQMPIIITYAFVMLFYTLGLSFFSGVAVFVVAFIVTAFLGIWSQDIVGVVMKKKDKRMNTTTQAVGNMKQLKFYGWTSKFKDEIKERRAKEIKSFKTLAWINAFLIASMYFFPAILSSVVFSTYIGTGHVISLSKAFMVLVFFSMIEEPLRQLPMFLAFMFEMIVSMGRLQEYLESTEGDSSKFIDNQPDSSSEDAIRISKSSYSWGIKRNPKEDDEENKKKKDKKPDASEANAHAQKAAEERVDALDDISIHSMRQPLTTTGQTSRSSDDPEAKPFPSQPEPQVESEQGLEQIVTLKSIDLSIKRGEFVCVVGDVGSGKSSLLQAMVGELLYVPEKFVEDRGGLEAVVKGERALDELQSDLVKSGQMVKIGEDKPIQIRGRLAYVQQEAWIQNQTIRDNILFGLPLDKERYVDVVRSCELERDLQILQAGDLTEIGEKGINLSGGQKARVSLARAVYSDRDVYLLDDPISALDAHVRRQVFSKVILGCLKDKTTVLVTHAIDFLHMADRIIIMEKGRIACSGTFDEVRMNPQFDGLLKLNQINQQAFESPEQQPAIQVSVPLKLNSTELEVQDSSSAEKLAAFEQFGRVSEAYDGKIIQNENHEVIQVNSKEYFRLIGFHGGFKVYALLQVLMVLSVGCSFATDFAIGMWANLGILEDQQSEFKYYVTMSLTFASAAGVFVLFRGLLIFFMSVRSSQIVHDKMIEAVMGAPMNTFFDVTPTGTLLNRFSKDLQVLDEGIAFGIEQVFEGLYELMVVMGIILFTNWYVITILPFIFIACYLLFKYAVVAYRETNRIESVSKSPLLNFINESFNGTTTIRAFGKQDQFISKSYEILDKNVMVNQVLIGSWCWYGIRMDFISIVLMITAASLAIIYRYDTNPVLISLSFQYVLNLETNLQTLLFFLGDLEKEMVSVVRCFKLFDAPQEDRSEQVIPSTSWPDRGEVVFRGVNLRYRPNTEQVLNGLTFDIKPGEKIGIVGRTGAGKSTLSLALTRIVEVEAGQILVDGVDLRQVGIDRVRRSITIIPQDPTLFAGSLRFNIDPERRVPDEEIVALLHDAGLSNLVASGGTSSSSSSSPQSILDTVEIAENGSNLSSGEKQLLCICRAILRHNKVIILDEATANIDLATEKKIQALIEEKFKECTVITIAHRLQTVLESDRVMVMEAGQVAEFDDPRVLQNNPDSRLSGLIEQLKRGEV